MAAPGFYSSQAAQATGQPWHPPKLTRGAPHSHKARESRVSRCSIGGGRVKGFQMAKQETFPGGLPLLLHPHFCPAPHQGGLQWGKIYRRCTGTKKANTCRPSSNPRRLQRPRPQVPLLHLLPSLGPVVLTAQSPLRDPQQGVCGRARHTFLPAPLPPPGIKGNYDRQLGLWKLTFTNPTLMGNNRRGSRTSRG